MLWNKGHGKTIGALVPANGDKAFKDLGDKKFIHKNDGGTWDVSDYGGIDDCLRP